MAPIDQSMEQQREEQLQQLRKIGYKVVLVGDGGVGKTTFINRILTGAFTKKYEATTGAHNYPVSFQMKNGQRILFRVWDTAGQERKSGLREVYYVGATAGIFFFDVTSRVTCQNLREWVTKFRDTVGLVNGVAPPPIVVVANKIDVRSEQKVDLSTVRAVLKGINFEYVEISSKTGLNYERPFTVLVQALTGLKDVELTPDLNIEPIVFQESLNDDDGYNEFLKQAAYMAPEE